MGLQIPPQIIFTIRGNAKSESVLEILRELSSRQDMLRIFESEANLHADGIDRVSAVALFDAEKARGEFHMCTNLRTHNKVRVPGWANVIWSVGISSGCKNPKRCALQISAVFMRDFSERILKHRFPWGVESKGKNHTPYSSYRKRTGFLEMGSGW